MPNPPPAVPSGQESSVPGTGHSVQDDGLIDYIRQASNLFLSIFFNQAVQYLKRSIQRDIFGFTLRTTGKAKKYTISTFYTKP